MQRTSYARKRAAAPIISTNDKIIVCTFKKANFIDLV